MNFVESVLERKSCSIVSLYLAVIKEYVNPCQPSPCGPNSQCRELNKQAVCSCLPEYVGTPPSCRPECTTNSECSYDKACVNHRCVDPCPGACGSSAECRVFSHSPICTCRSGFTGNAFTLCYPIPPSKMIKLENSLYYKYI